MKRKNILLSLLFLTALLLLFRFLLYTPILESTTQNIDVISKAQNTTTEERWIVLSNDKKIYIENFSIWALIQVNQNYTIVYDLMRKSGRYELRTIVPGDYKGSF